MTFSQRSIVVDKYKKQMKFLYPDLGIFSEVLLEFKITGKLLKIDTKKQISSYEIYWTS